MPSSAHQKGELAPREFWLVVERSQGIRALTLAQFRPALALIDSTIERGGVYLVKPKVLRPQRKDTPERDSFWDLCMLP